jgi:hypothetical protein
MNFAPRPTLAPPPPPGCFSIDTVEAALTKLDIDVPTEQIFSVIREIEASKMEQYYQAWAAAWRKLPASLHSPLSYL